MKSCQRPFRLPDWNPQVYCLKQRFTNNVDGRVRLTHQMYNLISARGQKTESPALSEKLKVISASLGSLRSWTTVKRKYDGSNPQGSSEDNTNQHASKKGRVEGGQARQFVADGYNLIRSMNRPSGVRRNMCILVTCTNQICRGTLSVL